MVLKQVEFRQGVRENAHWALNSGCRDEETIWETPESHRPKKISMQNVQHLHHSTRGQYPDYTKGSPFVLTSFLSTWCKLESSKEGASTDKMPP